jgi:transcription elongation factor GreA
MEARIRQIRALLENAQIREVSDTGRVDVGSVVTVVDENDEEMELFVASPENKVPGYVLASPSSPIGRAVLGARVGDELAYEAPGGTFRVRITAIRPYDGQP